MTGPSIGGIGDDDDEDRDGEFSPGDKLRSTVGFLYAVVRILGRGGHATVYQVVNELGQDRVLKVIHRHYARSEKMVERLHKEAKTLAQIAHPNIVQVYTAGVLVDSQQAFIEMELLQGYDGRRFIAEGPVEVAVALETLIHVASALAEAHSKGFIHQDLKLDNIFCHYDQHSREWVVKLLDFGVVRALGQAVDERTSFEGTLEYGAPEQVSRTPRVSTKVDLYALGIMAFELFTGRRPHLEAEEEDRRRAESAELFESRAIDPLSMCVVAAKCTTPAPRLSDFIPISRPIADLVAALLEIDPDKRPTDALAVREELEALHARVVVKRPKTTTQEFRASMALEKPVSRPNEVLLHRVITVEGGPSGNTLVLAPPVRGRTQGNVPRTAPMPVGRSLSPAPRLSTPPRRPATPPGDASRPPASHADPMAANAVGRRAIRIDPEQVKPYAAAYLEANPSEPTSSSPQRPRASHHDTQTLLTQVADAVPSQAMGRPTVRGLAPEVDPQPVAWAEPNGTTTEWPQGYANHSIGSYVEPNPARVAHRRSHPGEGEVAYEPPRPRTGSRPPSSQTANTRVIERASVDPPPPEEPIEPTRSPLILYAVALAVGVALILSASAWLIIDRSRERSAASAVAVTASAAPIVAPQLPAAAPPVATARPAEAPPVPPPVATQDDAPPSPPSAVTPAVAARPANPPSTPAKSATTPRAKAHGVPDIGEADDVDLIAEWPPSATPAKPAPSAKSADRASLLRSDWKDAPPSKKPPAAKPSLADEDPMKWIIRFDAGPPASRSNVPGLEEK